MTQRGYYSLITNNGLLKEAAASSGSPVNLTHIAVGDGNGISYNPTGSQTALVNEVYRTTLTHVEVDETNPNQLFVEGVLNEEIGPFYIREIGIFDSDGQLFAIGKYPETYKSPIESGSGKRLYIRMILGFTNSPQVNLIQSEDLNNDPNFNASILAAIDEINYALSAISSALTQKLAKSQNLSDLSDVAQALTHLGLGSAALKDIGSATGKVPLLGTQSASESLAGLASIANDAEARAASDDQKIITAKKQTFLGSAHYQTGALVSGTAAMPYTTRPNSSHGTQVLSLTYTPKRADSYLYIDVRLICFISTGDRISAALFKDAVTDAIACGMEYCSTSNEGNIISFRHRIASGAASAQTFKVRAGPNASGYSFFINGYSSTNYHGGYSVSSITIEERME